MSLAGSRVGRKVEDKAKQLPSSKTRIATRIYPPPPSQKAIAQLQGPNTPTNNCTETQGDVEDGELALPPTATSTGRLGSRLAPHVSGGWLALGSTTLYFVEIGAVKGVFVGAGYRGIDRGASGSTRKSSLGILTLGRGPWKTSGKGLDLEGLSGRRGNGWWGSQNTVGSALQWTPQHPHNFRLNFERPQLNSNFYPHHLHPAPALLPPPALTISTPQAHT